VSGSNTDSDYTLGAIGYRTDGTWNIIFDTDQLYFKVYGKALQSYSEATIKTQGSYALKAVAEATDSLNKTLTKTF
jgi:hypothetical protein